MGEVLSMSQARRKRAIERAEEKVRKEEERNRQAMANGSMLNAALQKYGSFTGKQLKKKENTDGDIQN